MKVNVNEATITTLLQLSTLSKQAFDTMVIKILPLAITNENKDVFEGTGLSFETELVNNYEDLGLLNLKMVLSEEIIDSNPDMVNSKFKSSLGMLSFDYKEHTLLTDILYNNPSETISYKQDVNETMVIMSNEFGKIELHLLIKYGNVKNEFYIGADDLYGMFRKQMTLNNTTCGTEWYERKISEKTGKDIDWSMCVHSELMELIESTPWEHWKKKEMDLPNVYIEFVDIWHFLMSWVMESTYDSIMNNDANIELKMLFTNPQTDVKDLEHIIISNSVTTLDNDLITMLLFEVYLNIKNSSPENIENILIKFLKHWLLTSDEDQIMFNIKMFMTILIIISKTRDQFDSDSLIKLYYGKNILNDFRQANGYVEGKYKKMWTIGGITKEDNYFMQSLLVTFTKEEVVENAELIKLELTKMYQHQ